MSIINKESSTVDLSSSQELKQQGMQQSVDHADSVIPKWSKLAYDCLIRYAKTKRVFMVEDIRRYATVVEKLPIPPSKRAWGSIIIKAKKNKVVEHIGYNQVKNRKAHMANASMWQSLIYEQLF